MKHLEDPLALIALKANQAQLEKELKVMVDAECDWYQQARKAYPEDYDAFNQRLKMQKDHYLKKAKGGVAIIAVTHAYWVQNLLQQFELECNPDARARYCSSFVLSIVNGEVKLIQDVTD